MCLCHEMIEHVLMGHPPRHIGVPGMLISVSVMGHNGR